jgi:folate-binding protein YgfZ
MPVPSNVFFVMRGWEAVEVRGADSLDFLNRLTSADFKKLMPGDFTPGTLLAPTGKILVYFKALAFEAGRFTLLVPPSAAGAPAPAQAAFEAFERMHFREDLAITPVASDWVYFRVLLQNETLVDSTRKGAGKRSFWMNEARWATPPFRADLGIAVPAHEADAVKAALAAAGIEERGDSELFRLRAADPAWPAELNQNVLALEAGLANALHENKGCYPGQEVIERIRAMGQVPRMLFQFRGEGAAPSVPASIRAGEQECGTLTSAVADPIDGGWVGLGFVKRLIAAAEPAAELNINGSRVRNVRAS